MILNRSEYLDKVLGCWLGKNIGGTLGEPFEWRRQVNDVSFYTVDLGGEPLPNDDLDIQLLWLIALEEQGLDVDARTLGSTGPSLSPRTGRSTGSPRPICAPGCSRRCRAASPTTTRTLAVRSFVRNLGLPAPGCPQIAARYAYEDAIIDHGNGEGTYGEVFCAALESAAFVVGDVGRLIDIALSYIPEDCGVAGAVRQVIASHRAGRTWLEARDALLADYRGGAFFGRALGGIPADHEKGFFTGQRGWDAPSNIGIVVLALLYGAGDFGQTVCTAVNCGEDTDCTAATVGALYGILHGAQTIPSRWVEPIGHTIRTVTLNLGDLGHFGAQVPGTVENLTERTARLAEQVLARHRAPLALTDGPTDLARLTDGHLCGAETGRRLFRNPGGPIFRFPFFEVDVDYGEDPLARSGVPKTVRLTLHNTHRAQAILTVRWYAPEGWTVSPAPLGAVQVLPGHLADPRVVAFTLSAERIDVPLARFVVELTSEGRPTAMLVPITLLNGDLLQPADEAL